VPCFYYIPIWEYVKRGISHDSRGEKQAVDALLALQRNKCGGELVELEGGALALDCAGCKAIFATILVTLQCPAT
jgi:hypothetical protein